MGVKITLKNKNNRKKGDLILGSLSGTEFSASMFARMKDITKQQKKEAKMRFEKAAKINIKVVD